MRRIIRSVGVVCLVLGAVSLYAAPVERDSRGAGVVRKAVKRVVRALGDFITVPIPSPRPNPQP